MNQFRIWGGLLCALALPASADAQVTLDYPDSDSPSGRIYEIPLEGGRLDAAPRPRKGAERSAPPAGSTVRSENGFGSSAQVPLEVGKPSPGDDRGPRERLTEARTSDKSANEVGSGDASARVDPPLRDRGLRAAGRPRARRRRNWRGGRRTFAPFPGRRGLTSVAVSPLVGLYVRLGTTHPPMAGTNGASSPRVLLRRGSPARERSASAERREK
jgi:hypothetical protein